MFLNYVVEAAEITTDSNIITLKNGIDAISVENEDYFIAGKVRFYEGDSLVKGNIDLDYKENEDSESSHYFKGIIVDGDLKVEGNIFNREDDYGKFLDVRGDLYVDNLVIGGAQVKVQGNIYVKYFTIETYNHGVILADALYVPVLLVDERSPDLKTNEHIIHYLHREYDDPNELNYPNLKAIFKNDEEIVMTMSWAKSKTPDFSLGDFTTKILNNNAEALLKQILDYQEKHFSKSIIKKENKKEVEEETIPSNPLVFIKKYANKVEINGKKTVIKKLTKSMLTDITLLDLSDNDLEKVPSFISHFEKLSYLDLSSNLLKEIPDSFNKLAKLEYLTLSNNKISTFSKNISQLEMLKTLDLESNEIRVIPKSINNLKNLENLNFGHNLIVVVSKEIGELKQLTSLSLQLNNIETLPSSLYDLSNLESLDLSYCRITISDDIEKLTKLTDLNISRNPLKSISASILTLKNLKKLNIRYTYIGELPKDFSQLTKLEWLDLGSNQFTQIPKVLTQLKHLTDLRMFNCRITQLPSYMKDFLSLKHLRVNGNNMVTVDGITFPPLNSLNLNNTDLLKIPSSITNITSLKELDLGSNEITEIPPEIGQLINLESFEIGNYEGKISNLPKEFSNLKAMVKLDLSSNLFKTIPIEVLALNKLRSLNMGYNQISVIPKEISYLPELRKLFIGENKITRIPQEIADLTFLETFLIYGNPIDNVPENILDDDLEALREYLNKDEDGFLLKLLKKIF